MPKRKQSTKSTSKNETARLISRLVDSRDSVRDENTRLKAVLSQREERAGWPHSYYGPCDGFGRDASCSECKRVEFHRAAESRFIDWMGGK